MKTLLLIIIPIIINCQYNGKVGINTSEPLATLDVNGTLRVRDLPQGSKLDKILVVNNGEVRQVSASEFFTPVNKCPIFLKTESSGYYLKFKSDSSIPNPNNPLIIEGLNFTSAGTWIAENNYFYSYSNISGQSLNLIDFKVYFGSGVCAYKN